MHVKSIFASLEIHRRSNDDHGSPNILRAPAFGVRVFGGDVFVTSRFAPPPKEPRVHVSRAFARFRSGPWPLIGGLGRERMVMPHGGALWSMNT